MDHRKQLREIAAFLKPYQRIWQNEIMLMYPHPLAGYPAEWLEELASFTSLEDLIALEKKEVKGLVRNPDLFQFYEEIENLSRVPRSPQLPPMPENAFTFLYMIPKKQHEIRSLAPVVNAYYQELGIEEIVDIGGGIGLLAQTLNNQYGLKTSSVDMDPILQRTGMERHRKNAKDPSQMVTYHELKISAEEEKFRSLLSPRTLTLGLHTCGELANHQIKASARAGAQGVINFGCCYQRLDHQNFQNVSEFTQSMPDKLIMNQFALTLAARAHKKMDEKDQRFKIKVKPYRYTMHMLLHDHYHQKQLLTLGNSAKKLYDAPFSEYAREQLRRVELPLLSESELEEYYHDRERQKLIWRMLAAGFIRNAFGRLLELYVLLDRVIYLEENGYETKLMSFFDEELSPRNLGIVGLRRS